MLGMLLVLIWEKLAGFFPQIFQHTILSNFFSYIFYTICSASITILALKKNKIDRIIDGFLIGLVNSIATIIYYFLWIGIHSNFITIILTSFTIGGGIGGVINQKYLKENEK